MRIGVLALQGAFREHAEVLSALGVEAVLVKLPAHLNDVDAIVLPGGESTTQDKLLTTSELREPLAIAVRSGMPCFATCAGVILLATEVLDGRPDQTPLGLLDISVRRNGYGRQIDSFEAPLEIGVVGPGDFPGVFIRAPKIERLGSGEVLAMHHDSPVLLRDGAIWGATFHPELSRDSRLHQQFVAQCS